MTAGIQINGLTKKFNAKGSTKVGILLVESTDKVIDFIVLVVVLYLVMLCC